MERVSHTGPPVPEPGGQDKAAGRQDKEGGCEIHRLTVNHTGRNCQLLMMRRRGARARARARPRGKENSAGGRNGCRARAGHRDRENERPYSGKLLTIFRPDGVDGTPFVKLKAGVEKGLSPPKTFTAAATTLYCPFGSVARS